MSQKQKFFLYRNGIDNIVVKTGHEETRSGKKYVFVEGSDAIGLWSCAEQELRPYVKPSEPKEPVLDHRTEEFNLFAGL